MIGTTLQIIFFTIIVIKEKIKNITRIIKMLMKIYILEIGWEEVDAEGCQDSEVEAVSDVRHQKDGSHGCRCTSVDTQSRDACYNL